MSVLKPPIFCLLGPTATGKTQLAVELVARLPLEIISVDSAMVYQGMDIGTAKPDATTLALAPHHLIDLVDPKENYSAGCFRQDALQTIKEIFSRGKFPLLVGGTMLYFRVLQQGLANMPRADANLRATLSARAASEGWENLYQWLLTVDPVAAMRIDKQDHQRIQRALEVYLLTGKPISIWHKNATHVLADYHVTHLGLLPLNREQLHARIAARFHVMLEMGFIAEVEKLFLRGDLNAELPAMRAVGYREIWRYLANEITYAEMCEQAMAATRQLAKRQMTWLRSWPEMMLLDVADKQVVNRITDHVVATIKHFS